MDGRVLTRLEQSRAEQSECALDTWWGVKYIVSIHTRAMCCCSSPAVFFVPWRVVDQSTEPDSGLQAQVEN